MYLKNKAFISKRLNELYFGFFQTFEVYMYIYTVQVCYCVLYIKCSYFYLFLYQLVA